MKRALAVTGNVNVDLIMGPVGSWPQQGTELILDHDDLRVGGAAGNSALAWMGLGTDFTIAANVGSDAFGRWLATGFGKRSALWPTHAASTCVSVGLTHPNDERTFFTTKGHLPLLTWAETRKQLEAVSLNSGFLLVCGSFTMVAQAEEYDAMFDWASARNIDIALDTGWPPEGWTDSMRRRVGRWAARSQHLLLNEIEAMGLTGTGSIEEAVPALGKLMPKDSVAVVKAGPRGAFAGGLQGIIHVPAPKVIVRDSIGAGDAFNAGYLLALANGRGLEAAVQSAVLIASTALSTSPRRYGPVITHQPEEEVA